MQRPFEEVLLRAVQVGSPPQWDDVPAEFQSDLATLDRLDDAREVFAGINLLWKF